MWEVEGPRRWRDMRILEGVASLNAIDCLISMAVCLAFEFWKEHLYM
jgi:hypothetical protein